MLKSQNVRETLINNAIIVMATDGLDKTTTKSIVEGTGISEVCIYMNFSDKDDLLAKSFAELDCELLVKTKKHIKILYEEEYAGKEQFLRFFKNMWKYLVESYDKSFAYIQYYHSQYFQKYSADSHRKRYAAVEKELAEICVEGANVRMILNHIIYTLITFAVDHMNGGFCDDATAKKQVFELLYHSVQPYIKKAENA